jgi:hypothetical protein
MPLRIIVLAVLLCGRPSAWCAATAEPAIPPALKAEAACLDRASASLNQLLARPLDPQAARALIEAAAASADGNLREALLYTAAVALAICGDSGLPVLRARLANAYPASRYAERLDEVDPSAPTVCGPVCGPACGKDCPVCNGTGTPAPAPALKSMADEALYLIHSRTRAMLDDVGSADVRDSGRNLTPPELKPALKAFADWMLMQQRRLEVKIVSRLYASREGGLAVLCMTVTPEFAAQDYDWRLTIAKACVKDWAVKCKDLTASAGFRLYDDDGRIVGDYNYRNGRVWLPKDGEPPREPGPEPAPPAAPPPDLPTPGAAAPP